VLSIWLVLLAGSIFPQVEDPWPGEIGVTLPITLGGALGFLASVLFAAAPEARRDRAVRNGGIAGIAAGLVFYLVSLAVQIFSSR
jgi:hypothetical protein